MKSSSSVFENPVTKQLRESVSALRCQFNSGKGINEGIVAKLQSVGNTASYEVERDPEDEVA